MHRGAAGIDLDGAAGHAAANQVLGGGVAGRLFMDVREKRSLAYSTYSYVSGFAHGPSLISLSAGTQTAKTGLTLKALLEHLNKMGSAPLDPEELSTATRYLSDAFLLRLETTRAVSSMTASLGILGLGDKYYDEYRAAVTALDEATVQSTAKKYYVGGHAIVVVAGDADRLQGPLSHFGRVTVIDPDKEFSVVKTVPHNPKATIELTRIEGT